MRSHTLAGAAVFALVASIPALFQARASQPPPAARGETVQGNGGDAEQA